MKMHLLLLSSLSLLCSWAGPFESNSHPKSDPSDLTIWPNQISRANSDEWLAKNHDRIRLMRPRLLLVNFSQESSREKLEKITTDLLRALAESSRYHGYKNPEAPVFLDYQVFKFVDLREPAKTKGNSSKAPVKARVKEGINMDYGEFFSERFAAHYGVPDPKDPNRFLTLKELVDLGYVHELWMFGEATPELRALESVELKPVYNENFVRQGDRYVQAGNGGDPDQKWTGRSIRLAFINASRGIGCFMESLSHSIEGMANSKAIPYFTQYFHEFSGHDFQTRYGMPFTSLYAIGYGNDQSNIEYPDPATAIIPHRGEKHRITNYVAYGGNVHFTPNGRRHYDLTSPHPVQSTIEDWRIGSGPNGHDEISLWSVDRFAPYREQAPDCMGPWLIYWRQNFPGLDNRQKDNGGQPMKNWWPFLFY